MSNPVYQILKKQKPFTYFHTHVVTQEILAAAIAAKKSLELDLSIATDGSVYIGHPLAMYRFYHLPPPRNVALEVVLPAAKAAGVYLVLDCKDVRVLPTAQTIIQDYGAERCLLHACTEALVFKPYSKKIVVEPHWGAEQIELAAILQVKQATQVPLALCCRGISQELLAAQGEDAVVRKILEVAVGNAEIIVPNFPKDELPPLAMMHKLLDHRLLSLFNVDRVLPEQRPPVFLGTTDILEQASNPENF